MKGIFKKGIAVIICVCMLLGAVPLGCFADLNISELFTFKAEASASAVTYYVDGEIYEIIEPTSNYFELPIPDDPTKAGYSFVGWADSSGTVLMEIEIIEKIKNYDPIWDDTELAFYAIWHKNSGTVGPYTVSFYVDGVYYDFATYSNGIIIMPSDPAPKIGYSFVGWATANGNIVNVANYAAKVNDNFAVYAAYEAHEFDVSFNANSGTFSNGSNKYTVKVRFGDIIPFPQNPERAGYIFVGWKTLDGADAPTVLNEEGNNYTATWDAISYPIVLDYGGYQETFYGSYGTYISLPEPTKEGFTFKGWVVDGVRYASQVVVPVGGSYCVAEWKINSYNINFYDDEGNLISSTPYEYGAPIPAPEMPVREGYTFLDWIDSSNGCPVPATMPAQDLNFYPSWIANSETEPETSAQFPSGYDFETDKWGQMNINDRIDEVTYRYMYGPSKGKLLYILHEDDDGHGICYGYTVTTAALLKNRDSIGKFRNVNTEEYINSLSEVAFLSSYESTEFYLNAADFVKLGYIYQFDSDVKEYEKSTKNNLEGLCNAVNAYVNGTGDPLIINVHDKKEGHLIKKNAHSIFPIGILYGSENIIIYIYDSNLPTVKQELIISSDYSSWNYTPSYSDENYDLSVYNSEENGAYIDYSFPADEIYDFVTNTEDVNSRYMSYLNLLVSSGSSFTVLVTDERKPDILRIDELIGNEESVLDDETQHLYWVEEGYTQISLMPEEDTNILVSDVDSSIEASAFASKTVSFDFSDGMRCELLDVEADKMVTVTLTTYTEDSETEYIITGISNGEDALVSMNENVIKTSGLNSVSVQLLVDGDEKDKINVNINDGDEIEFTVSENMLSSNVYEITWNIDGAETTTICKEGSAITTPEAPTKTGYTFAGWTPQIPDAMPAEDLNFTSTWTPNSYNAVLDANGGKWADGSEIKTVPADFNAEIIAPENPAKQGYIFSCWSPEIGIMDDINGKEFTAVWLTATDTRYTVETYTMNTAGEYEKSVQTLSGTTDLTVSTTPDILPGFKLNEAKSILSGTVAADNSLVLKVYIDRNTYTFTTVADGVSTSVNYLYGSIIAEPAAPVKSDYKFIKWNNEIPSTMPAENVTVTAVFEKSYICPDCGDEILGEAAINAHVASEAKMKATVKIKNNSGSKTINYGETLRLTAITANMPNDAKICWYVDGMKKGEGTTFDVHFESGTKTVEVKLADANGNVLKDASGNEISDSQEVSVNSSFWQKIVSFFKNLFRINRTIEQTI